MHEVSCSFSHNLLDDAMAALQQSWMNPGKPPLTVRARKITLSLLAWQVVWKKWHILAANTTDQRATAGYLKPDWSWLISIIFSKPPPCQSQTFPDQRCGQAANQEPWKVVKSGFLLEIVHSDDFLKSPRVAKEILLKGHVWTMTIIILYLLTSKMEWNRIVCCLYIIGCVSSPKTIRSRWISWFLPKYFDVVHRTLLATERA